MRLPHAWHTSCPCLNVWNSDHWPAMDSSHCLHSWFTRWVHSFYQVGGSSEPRCSMISFHDMTWRAQIEDCCKHGKGVKEAEQMPRALSLTCELQIELGMLTRYVPRNQHLACLSKGFCNRAIYWFSFLLLENDMAAASSAATIWRCKVQTYGNLHDAINWIQISIFRPILQPFQTDPKAHDVLLFQRLWVVLLKPSCHS